MNKVPQEKPSKQSGTSLSAVLEQTFSETESGLFAQRLTGLVAALLSTPSAHLYRHQDDNLVRIAGTAPDSAELTDIATAAARSDDESVQAFEGWLTCKIVLPDRQLGTLLARIPQGNQAVLALANERMTLLQGFAKARHLNPDLDRLQTAVEAAFRLSDPTPKAMQDFADAAAALTGVDYAALAQFEGHRISSVAVSGQSSAATRAMLPDNLKGELAETAKNKITTATRQVISGVGQDHGMILDLDTPRRNASMLPLLAGTILHVSPPARSRAGWLRRLRRMTVGLLLFFGISMIPLPEGIDVPATVQATNFRIVTSPQTAPVLEINVSENDFVRGGETVLASLDTVDIDNELIALQAEYNAALLARETARAGRDAAGLRNAELEVDRLTARIDLIDQRKSDAIIIAPIDGLVVGGNFASRQGSVLQQGEDLLQIADPSQMQLILQISQGDFGRVSAGLVGPFRPDFDPSLRFEATITTVSPAARDDDREPTFRGEAELPDETSQLRHGMTGVLRLDRAWRPAGLIVFDALRDWVLLRLWL